jgi:hypothetical protein
MTTDQGKQNKPQFGPIASATQFHTSNSQDPGVFLAGQLPFPRAGERPISPEDTVHKIVIAALKGRWRELKVRKLHR